VHVSGGKQSFIHGDLDRANIHNLIILYLKTDQGVLDSERACIEALAAESHDIETQERGISGHDGEVWHHFRGLCGSGCTSHLLSDSLLQ
jgi:hypothetical protein